MTAEAQRQREQQANGAGITKPKGILALDIDGTLTGPDGSIGERTRQAVHAAGESGWLVTIATGRSWINTKPVADHLELRVPLVTFNGALIRDSVTAEVLHYIPLPTDVVASIVSTLVEMGMQPLVVEDIRQGERFFTGPSEYDSERTAAWFKHLREIHMPVVRMPYDELARVGHAIRVTVSPDPEQVSALETLARERESQFRSITYEGIERQTFVVEFIHPSSTKATALRWLARQYGLEMADVVAVGDGINDVEMLAEAGFGVAMGNASERVRSEAEIVIGHHMDEGLADFIEDHLIDAAGVPPLTRLIG